MLMLCLGRYIFNKNVNFICTYEKYVVLLQRDSINKIVKYQNITLYLVRL